MLSRAVFARDSIGCLVDALGEAHCWGNSNYGRIGTNGPGSESDPTGAPIEASETGLPLFPVSEIAPGASFSCLLRSDHTVWCWGVHLSSTAGYGGLTSEYDHLLIDSGAWTDKAVPLDAPSLVGAKHVAVGYDHACAITAADGVVCWGRNDYEQAGQKPRVECPLVPSGTATCVSSPSTVDLRSAGASAIQQLALGIVHSCALDVDGRVWCWGRAEDDEVGGPVNPSTLDPCTKSGTYGPDAGGCIAGPVRVASLDTVAGPGGIERISAGGQATCALKAQRVYCWGLNYDGQLGQGDGPSSGATQVLLEGTSTPLSGVLDFAVGDNFSIAMTADGMFVWGYDWGTGDRTKGARKVAWE
jgi:alpha-tubulin suppressor-like RCC1 family protein